jgi:hypothetical protein
LRHNYIYKYVGNVMINRSLVSQNTSQSTSQSTIQPAIQSINQSISQSVNQSASQSISQSVSQPTIQSICQLKHLNDQTLLHHISYADSDFKPQLCGTRY